MSHQIKCAALQMLPALPMDMDLMGQMEYMTIMNADDEGSTSSHHHPLTLLPIMRIIFKQLHLNDLKSCKAVCKSWSSEINVMFRNSCMLVITSTPEGILKEKKTYIYGNGSLIQKIVYQHCDFEKFPKLLLTQQIKNQAATKFQLLTSVRFETSWINVSTFHEFLREVGPKLIDLDMTIHYLAKEEHKKAVVEVGGDLHHNPEENILAQYFPIKSQSQSSKSSSLMVFPRLKHLIFVSFTRIKLSSIFKTFPNLNTLALTGLSYLAEENPAGIGRQLRLPELTHLNISAAEIVFPFQIGPYGHYSENLLQMLKTMELKLKSLLLEHVTFGEDCNALESFLLSQKDTLENICLQSHLRNCYHNGTGLPSLLPKLKNARFSRPFITNINNLATTFPKLDAFDFVLDSFDTIWSTIVPKKIKPNRMIQKISFDWIDSVSLGKFLQVFTNLNELTIGLCNDKVLEVLFQDKQICANVKQLKLYDGGNEIMNDTGITGIEGEYYSQFLMSSSKARRNPANILNMKGLTDVYIAGKTLTQKSLIFGILQNPNLKSAFVLGMQDFEFTIPFKMVQFNCFCIAEPVTDNHLGFIIKKESVHPKLEDPVGKLAFANFIKFSELVKHSRKKPETLQILSNLVPPPEPPLYNPFELPFYPIV